MDNEPKILDSFEQRDGTTWKLSLEEGGVYVRSSNGFVVRCTRESWDSGEPVWEILQGSYAPLRVTCLSCTSPAQCREKHTCYFNEQLHLDWYQREDGGEMVMSEEQAEFLNREFSTFGLWRKL